MDVEVGVGEGLFVDGGGVRGELGAVEVARGAGRG